jgi:TonB family protein
MLLLGLAALAGQHGGAAQSSPAAPLEPSAPWVAEFEDTLCVLSRTYGAGEDKVQLAFKPLPGDERIEVIVLTPWKGRDLLRSGELEITLGPGGTSAKGPYRDYTIDPDKRIKGRERLLRVWVEQAELGDITAAKTLTVTEGKRSSWTFALKGTAKAMKVIDQCEDQLVRSWGFDPDALRKQTARATPITSPQSWIGYRDYPDAALRTGARGAVRLRYRVAKTGLPQECTILQGSGSALLDKTACDLIMKRARFHPALGPGGEPEDGLRSETVIWLL